MKAKPDVTINLVDLGVRLTSAGFNQDKIISVLCALEQDKMVAFGSGNRLLVLTVLPHQQAEHYAASSRNLSDEEISPSAINLSMVIKSARTATDEHE